MIVGPITRKKYGTKNFSAPYAKCLCKCGNIGFYNLYDVRRGHTISCGCYQMEMTTKHGMASRGNHRSRFYKTWVSMKIRCTNPKSTSYKYYGGRGISLCRRWHAFEGFRDDMYQGYLQHCEEYGEKDTEIDRINNELGYNPKNCRWVTNREQSANRRNSVRRLAQFSRGKTTTS